MSEFSLSGAPNTSALIIVRGEVQENHVHNFQRVMRYGGELAVVTTTELEEAMPTVGLHLDRGVFYKELNEMLANRRRCADGVAEYAADKFGLERYKYDVHMLDGAPQQQNAGEVDKSQIHWRGIARDLTERKPFRRDTDGGTGIWEYDPFKLVDTRLTGVDKQADEPIEGKMMSAAQLRDMVAEMQAGRLPVQFEYASATLLQSTNNSGDVNKARVTFTYPTVAKFERTVSLGSDTKNADGDTVIQRTEISTRKYVPEISVESQIALDDVEVANRRAIEEAIERHGDEDFYMMADDGTTEYNNAARLAPIYNTL